MVEYIIINETGEILDSILLPENEKVPDLHVKPWGDRGFFVPKWDFQSGDWIESLTVEEIAKKKKEIANEQNQVSSEEMNAMAILELTKIIFGGMGVE